jgi:hypothetical protein
MSFRMNKLRAFLAGAILLVAPLTAVAQTRQQKSFPIVLGYDLDGAAASATAVVNTATAADSTTFTIAAQPDACRPLLLTITDANASITAGTLTVVGTDDNGNYKTTVFTFAAAGSTTSALGTYCSVVSVITGVLTGEGGGADTLSVGTTGAAPYQYPIAWGSPLVLNTSSTADTHQAFQPNAAFQWAKTSPLALVKTTTANAVALTSFTASSGAFTLIGVGDIILVRDDKDRPVTLGVIAKADNDNITVDRPVTILRATGINYSFRRLKTGSGTYSGWFTTAPWQYFTIIVDVVQLVGTGGINVQVECTTFDVLTPVIISTLSPNITVVGTQAFVFSAPHGDACRVGLQWATNDDANDLTTNTEKINVYLVLQQ